MKAINLLRGLVMALIAALIITVLPVQPSLYARDDSGVITKEVKHKTGKHKKHKHHKKNKKTSTNNKTKDNKDTKTDNNTKDTKTNKK